MFRWTAAFTANALNKNALGVAKVRVQSATGTMMERISSGENLIGYNVLGSYALVRAKTDPSIGVVLPKDYTLVMSRVFFINKSAKNVNAAKLWLDYILSKRGQDILANKSDLHSLRDDVTGEATAAGLKKMLGADDARLSFSFAGTKLIKNDFTPVIGVPTVPTARLPLPHATSRTRIPGRSGNRARNSSATGTMVLATSPKSPNSHIAF